MEFDQKITDLQTKIDIERKCKEGAVNMLNKLTDKNALEQCQMNVYESQRRLDFLEGEMRKLQLRKLQSSGEPIPSELLDFLASPSSSGQPMALSFSLQGPMGNATGGGVGGSLDKDADPSVAGGNATAGGAGGSASAGAPSTGTSTSSSSTGHLFATMKSIQAVAAASARAKRNSEGAILALTSSARDGSRSLGNLAGGSGGDTKDAMPNGPGGGGQSTSSSSGSRSSGVFGNILSSFGVRTKSGTLTPKSASSSSSSLNSVGESGSSRGALTQFDFLRSETPITSEKVKYKLNEIRFKLDVEQKVKEGTERMQAAITSSSLTSPSSSLTTPFAGTGVGGASTGVAGLGGSGGGGGGAGGLGLGGESLLLDKKRAQEIEDKLKECTAKVAILMKAEQRYRGLYVADEEGDKEPPLSP
ncbi:hypothetical protein HK102_004396, partial [Quaeritorhiza haematococci]